MSGNGLFAQLLDSCCVFLQWFNTSRVGWLLQAGNRALIDRMASDFANPSNYDGGPASPATALSSMYYVPQAMRSKLAEALRDTPGRVPSQQQQQQHQQQKQESAAAQAVARV